jgi:hypothetical protein
MQSNNFIIVAIVVLLVAQMMMAVAYEPTADDEPQFTLRELVQLMMQKRESFSSVINPLQHKKSECI